MPKYNNRFAVPDHFEYTIVSDNNLVIGTMRIKPNRLLWKGKGQRSFKSVPLDSFISWISSAESGSRLTKS